MKTVESESEPRSLPELEPKLCIPAQALSIILKKFIENIMIAEEVFVNCYNFYFNPVMVEHASINVKKYKYSSKKKVIFSYKLSGAGAGAGAAFRISEMGLFRAN
jgi:hypothetical protein